MTGDISQLRRTAESRNVLVATDDRTGRDFLILSPTMHRTRHLREVLPRKIAEHPAFHVSKLAGIDEENSPRRSLPCAVLSRVRNQRQTGICVVKKSCGGRAIITSTTSASIIFRRMSPSPLHVEDMDPFASTTPACPVGFR